MSDIRSVQLQPCEPGQLTTDELKTLFLFEKLSDEQLAWLAERGCTLRAPAGSLVLREGDPADQFFVLLSGTIQMFSTVNGDEVVTQRTEQRGVYMGATQPTCGTTGFPGSTCPRCGLWTTVTSSCSAPRISATSCASGSRWPSTSSRA